MRLSILVGVLLSVVTLASPIRAGDISFGWGKPPLIGDVLGLDGVTIVSRSLDLDLRPLTVNEPMLVTAKYRLRNDGADLPLTLTLVTREGTAPQARVTLDGESVQLEKPMRQRTYQRESIVLSTPPIKAGSGAVEIPSVRPSGAQLIKFPLTVGQGKHVLEVKYSALAIPNPESGEPTKYWQVAYLFSSTSLPDSDGKVDVSVTVPEGWHVSAQPGLQREGDRFTGSFEKLPSPSLTLTLQSPYSLWPEEWLTRTFVLGCILLPISGILVGLWLSWRHRSFAWGLLVDLPLVMAWSLLLLYFQRAMLNEAGVPLHQRSSDVPVGIFAGLLRGLGGVFEAFWMGVIFLLSICLGLVLTLLSTWLTFLATRKQTLAPLSLEEEDVLYERDRR